MYIALTIAATGVRIDKSAKILKKNGEMSTIYYTHTHPARIDANIYDDLLKIQDLYKRSINSLRQKGARLVRNQYVEQIEEDQNTRNTLEKRHAKTR